MRALLPRIAPHVMFHVPHAHDQTPAGSIVAEVPEGVPPGQPFFVKLQAQASS